MDFIAAVKLVTGLHLNHMILGIKFKVWETMIVLHIASEKIQRAQILTKKELTLQGHQNVREGKPTLKFLEAFLKLVK